MSGRESTPATGSASAVVEASPSRLAPLPVASGKQLNQSELKLLHYYNLSHAAAGTLVGKIYSALFAKEQKSSKYSFPPVLSQKFCLHCGSLLIPGISVSIRIVDNEKVDDGETPGKRLRLSCLSCDNEQYEDDISPEKEIVKPTVGQTDGPAKAGNSKAKERTKKRKMNNNLSNLLHEKKKQKNEQSKANSLSLMEFLK
ncbi:Ribonuclease MRP protein subunit SNM1 [Candida viswanathii]|uniref:Ribonuclease MRP protein subunit SNM1 n=1 Tax=Candida viswanathii TaxID=5486 RepID=A0A367YHH3_9ASCO|nr:Ribonuclease MRP protein subunit SNM1 [Candida viswanathii]